MLAEGEKKKSKKAIDRIAERQTRQNAGRIMFPGTFSYDRVEEEKM